MFFFSGGRGVGGEPPTLSDSRALGPLEPPVARRPEQVVRNVDFKKFERLKLI